MAERNIIYTVQNVDKALELLEAVAESPHAVTLMSLAARVGLSRNKTFRILATLCEKGLVDRDDVTGAYRIGVNSVPLGQKLMKSSSLVTLAHPVLEDLARRHDEAVYMTVIKDDEVLFLNMVDCERQVKAAPFVGRKFPLFTVAAGKVMKALDSRDLLERLCKKRGRNGQVPDLDSLETELRQIRVTGVAVDNDGLGEGISSVAVAIRDYAGKIVGAITMLGPSVRMFADRLEAEIIPSMLEGAEMLSGKLGYAPV
jgi:DNA-binding IclR family transcriptional regulator